MTTWVCFLRPAIDKAFLAAADDRVRAIVQRHADYLTALRQHGDLVLAGRCWDGPVGVVIFDAPDRGAAEMIVADDPAVAEGMQSSELYEFDMPYPPSRGRLNSSRDRSHTSYQV